MTYDFDALTQRQRDVLGAIAMNQDAGHHPKTLGHLESLRLIAQYGERARRSPPTYITRWYMPAGVHWAWCEWCSLNGGAEAAEAEP